MRDASVSVDLLAVEKIILSIEKGSISAVEDAQKDSRLLNQLKDDQISWTKPYFLEGVIAIILDLIWNSVYAVSWCLNREKTLDLIYNLFTNLCPDPHPPIFCVLFISVVFLQTQMDEFGL